MANGHRDIHNYKSKYGDDMVICKVQICADVHQQNDETKMNETNKKTDRLIGNHVLVISFDEDFNHDGDGNDDGDVNDDDDGKDDGDVELHQLCSLGGFCDLVEPHPSF